MPTPIGGGFAGDCAFTVPPPTLPGHGSVADGIVSSPPMVA